MATEDRCCTIVPYFRIPAGKLESFKALCEQMVERTKRESKVLYYGFSFDGDQAHCREGFADAEGLLEHLDNVDSIFAQMLQLVELTRLEIHAHPAEIAKLRIPLQKIHPQFFTLEYGFRR